MKSLKIELSTESSRYNEGQKFVTIDASLIYEECPLDDVQESLLY